MRRRWSIKGLRFTSTAAFCSDNPDPGDIEGYWVEPGPDVYDRLDPYWIDFELILAPNVHRWKWRMWRITERMIKSDTQRERTVAQIDGFRQALAKVEQEASGKRSQILGANYRTMIRDLDDQVREYDELKRGELVVPKVERLDEVAPFITRIRIAKGISQTELGRRLGVSKQVISRYEESDYQTVAKLQEILDAIGVKALVTLSA